MVLTYNVTELSQTDQIWETRPGENLGLFMCLNASSESDLLSELNRRSEKIFLLEFRRDGEQIHSLYADTFEKAFVNTVGDPVQIEILQ